MAPHGSQEKKIILIDIYLISPLIHIVGMQLNRLPFAFQMSTKAYTFGGIMRGIEIILCWEKH